MTPSWWSFVIQGLRNPRQVGTIFSSGRRLAQAMVSPIDWKQPGHIIEIGAGSGPITAELLKHPEATKRTLIVERDAVFCTQLTRRFPQARIIQGDARQLAKLCQEHGVEKINAIVSSVPMILLSWKDQYQIMNQALSMGSNTKFIQLTYNIMKSPLPLDKLQEHNIAGKRYRLLLLGNFPPASIWLYHRELM